MVKLSARKKNVRDRIGVGRARFRTAVANAAGCAALWMGGAWLAAAEDGEEPAAAPVPVVVIDPGHGGSAVAGSLAERSNSSPNNARSPGGILEKDITLELSLLLKEAIVDLATERGAEIGVLLTREDDRNLDFIERAGICNRPDTAAIVSIHFNASAGGRSMGSLALVAARDRNPNYEADAAFGEELAEVCSEAVRRYLPETRSLGVITDGHLHGGRGSNFFFQLNRHAALREVPKCFLEVEFMDNPAVEKALLAEGREEKFRAIAEALAGYLVERFAR